MSELKEGVAVVTVGRTAPIPPGQQTMAVSLPVVIASDQTPVPVEVANQQVSESGNSGLQRGGTPIGA